MKLNDQDFHQLIKNAPLISIDFIVKNKENKVLLGLRENRPAKGYWFVPGGRIQKGETIARAFKRIAANELGIELEVARATLLGIYDHMYDDNFYEDGSFGTHYVVIGYKIKAELEPHMLPKIQHRSYRWFSIPEIQSSEQIHANTKAYFN